VKRLAVIRVRPRNRIHFLLKGDRPIYIRNQDRAIPAPAAELRALIDREQFDAKSSQGSVDPFRPLPADFKITRTRDAGTIQERLRNRTDAQSFMRIAFGHPKRSQSAWSIALRRTSKIWSPETLRSFKRPFWQRRDRKRLQKSQCISLQVLPSQSGSRRKVDNSLFGCHRLCLRHRILAIAPFLEPARHCREYCHTLALGNSILTAEDLYGEIDLFVNV